MDFLQFTEKVRQEENPATVSSFKNFILQLKKLIKYNKFKVIKHCIDSQKMVYFSDCFLDYFRYKLGKISTFTNNGFFYTYTVRSYQFVGFINQCSWIT